MSAARRSAVLGTVLAALAIAAPPAPAAPACTPGRASATAVGAPTPHVAWRARLIARTPLAPAPDARSHDAITPDQASWLLVLRARRGDDGCRLLVRLPARPNDAAAWVDADRVELEPTPWRLTVSRRERTLTVHRGGHRVRRFRVVVGAPGTPTPAGLFAILDVWRTDPGGFLGAYVLPLTAHSHVLQEFGDGDGRVGLHGRGGASLRDPLGTAASHGCVRLSNRAIAWLVRNAGATRLAGVPVRVR